MPRNNQTTPKSKVAVVSVIAAAASLDAKNEGGTFTEFDLTVQAWILDPDRFGLRGYKQLYPDHKRVIMEIVGSKSTSPFVKGYMEKVSPNVYQMTPLGRAVGYSMLDWDRCGKQLQRIRKFTTNKVYTRWRNDPPQPEDIRDVELFLGGVELVEVRRQVETVLEWCTSRKLEYLAHYDSQYGSRVHVNEIASMLDFLTAMEHRFPILTSKTKQLKSSRR